MVSGTVYEFRNRRFCERHAAGRSCGSGQDPRNRLRLFFRHGVDEFIGLGDGDFHFLDE